MAEEARQIDELTGTATTGHDWDGISELNTPLPRWWLWLFYACIVWAIGYWVLYPAWPLISNSTQGVWGWHSRAAVETDLTALACVAGSDGGEARISIAQRNRERSATCSISPARKDALPSPITARLVTAPAVAAPRAILTSTTTIGCGAASSPRSSNTIRYGARAGNDKGHQGNMPPFAGALKPNEISAVADYVRSLSGLATEKGADLALGKKVFADNCAVCHGPEGKGNQELGSANLTDKIWLYDPSKAAIMAGVEHGHGGVMPTWEGRLSDPVIKALTVYVWTFGGGTK